MPYGAVGGILDRAIGAKVPDGPVGSVLDCHPEPARSLLADMLENPRTNVYTVEKEGVKKLIFQTPWYDEGEYAGFMELSMVLPEVIPNRVRKPKP